MTLELQRKHTPVAAGRMHRFIHDFHGTSQSVAASTIKLVRAGIAVSLIYCIVPLSSASLYAQQTPPAGPQYIQLTYEQLNQLVAPIALYPDALVAQILAASTYPPEVADADRFVQHNVGMPPQELARIVNTQAWDPSVKALTAFPSVLSNLGRNLDWTSKLGNAYYNQPQDVMAAVQMMRQRAYGAGTLRSTPQESVVYQQGYIVIQPVNPEVVYVPVYNPVVVYGAPVPIYPTYSYSPAPSASSIAVAAAIGFAAGVAVGTYSPYHWGYSCWSPNWYSHTVVYNNTAYVSRSVTVVNQGYYGYYDHSPSARSYNQQVVYGPNGYASRTATTQGNQTNVHIAGPNGTASRYTTHYGDGNNSTTLVGPNGQAVNRTVTGRGTGNVSATTTGPNGTLDRSTSFNGNGNYSSTVTGPNGQAVDRTVTGRGTGNVNATTTGPNGTLNRSTSFNGDGNYTSTVTGPNGQAANRTVTGRGTGNVNATTTGPNGTVNRSTSFNGDGNYSSTVTGPNDQSVNRTVTGRGTGNVNAATSGPNGAIDRSTSFTGNGASTTVTKSPNGIGRGGTRTTPAARSRIWTKAH
jgi:uncharacterized protein DUF3300